jgi:putative phosphoesterase
MIAIISDVHGNLPALRAVIDAALKLGCTRFLSLGDVVGYYAQPGECIDLLRAHGVVNIMGNHDYYLASGEGCPRSPLVSRTIEFAQSIIDEDQMAWLRKSFASHREADILYLHGGPDDPRDQYLYSVSRANIPADIKVMFCGHTHVQKFAKFSNGNIFCNPGSVGQPRDGDSRAAFAVVTDKEIAVQRVSYDIDETIREMQRAGFPPHFYENLRVGAQIGGRIDKIDVIDD